VKVELWPIDQPIAYARNPRKNVDAAVDKVAASLREFGWKQPVVVDEEGVIVVGHTRVLAAKKLGLTQVPVVVATDLTPTQIKAYRIADNRTGEEAEWDEDLLKLELEDLSAEDGFNLLATGFDEDELERLLKLDDTLEGMPGDPGAGRYQEQYAVVVVCTDASHQEKVFNQLQASGFECKVVCT
jgi:ParB-like chromosome segregation protein Spo0J